MKNISNMLGKETGGHRTFS